MPLSRKPHTGRVPPPVNHVSYSGLRSMRYDTVRGVTERPLPMGGRGVCRCLMIILLAAQYMGCETNPYTHRTQLLAVPKGDEMNLGAQAYQQVLHDPKVQRSRDPRE